MKIYKLNTILTVLLVVLFNTFSSSGFAFSQPVTVLDSRDYDSLREDQNTAALYVEEFNLANSMQVVTKNNSGNDGPNLGSSINPLSFEGASTTKNISNFLQDKRKILKHQIFPYHFFW